MTLTSLFPIILAFKRGGLPIAYVRPLEYLILIVRKQTFGLEVWMYAEIFCSQRGLLVIFKSANCLNMDIPRLKARKWHIWRVSLRYTVCPLIRPRGVFSSPHYHIPLITKGEIMH